MLISDGQTETFRRMGVLKLEKYLPIDKIDQAIKEMFERLEERGLFKNHRWTLDHLPQTKVPEGVSKLIGRTNDWESLGNLFAPEISDVISELLDKRPRHSPNKNGQVLFTIPNATLWTLPHSSWHLDIARLIKPGIPGIQAFTFLNNVTRGGGGTVAVRGSHHLLNGDGRISSKQVRSRLKQFEYFRKLMDKSTKNREDFLTSSVIVDGHEQSIVELYGDPGDVYLLDMRLLHTLAPNAGKVPRIMVTKRFFLREAYEEMYGALPKS